jgi:hypothetical protein
MSNTYTVELDISHEVTHEEVLEFAQDHGCRVLSRIENGPAGGNPLYTFASENINYLQELTEQVFGAGEFDEEEIRNMFVEV